MSKLPVFATVARAYSFVFGNLGLIYRLCWFPFLIIVLPDVLPPLGWATSATMPGAVAVKFALAVIVYIVQLFLTAMALVAIHRVILFGDRKPGVYLLFSVGLTEFYFAAVPLAFQVAFIALGFVAASVVGWPGRTVLAENGAVAFVIVPVIWVIGVWVACRLVSFYPLVVVTERIPIAEAWRLSGASFWRILGVFVVGSLPILAVGFIASAVVMPLILVAKEPGFADMQAMATTMKAISVALTFVLGIPLTALGVAFLCYCFKALAGYAPEDIVPSAAAPTAEPSPDPPRP